MIDKKQSDRLSALRLPLILGVIFIHAYSLTASKQAGMGIAEMYTDINAVVQLLLSEGVARLAVPIFFLMSGYFLYAPGDWSPGTYVEKLKARARSLIIPLVAWNLITLGIFALAQALSLTQRFFSGGTTVASFSGLEFANAVFGLYSSPIAYQFWFIRDLILLVIASPLLWLAVARVPRMALGAMLVLWLLTPKPYPIPAPEALLFFSAGLYAGTRGLSLFHLDRFARYLLVPYLAWLVATPIYLGTSAGLAIQKVGILLGVPLALRLSARWAEGRPFGNWLLKSSAASFFIFAAHEPLLTIVKKLGAAVLKPDSPLLSLVAYLAAPAVVATVLMVGHALLSSRLPRLTRWLSGGR